MKIAIIGLGLIGGSLALSLKKLDFVTSIVGYDHNKQHCQEAIKLALVEKTIEFDEINNYDVIFLAIPVDGIIAVLKKLKNIDEKTTIIDLGSTKEKIIKEAPSSIRKNFVAAHPMSGTEKFGPSAAIENLYVNKVVVLCELENSGSHQVEVAKKIFNALLMRIYYMSAADHDRRAAFISHMPHAISYSLANTVMNQENTNDILALAAGGFRDMSRLAKSSANMWEDIFRQNKINLLEAIELFEKELCILKQNIKDDNWQEVHKNIEAGNRLHEILK